MNSQLNIAQPEVQQPQQPTQQPQQPTQQPQQPTQQTLSEQQASQQRQQQPTHTPVAIEQQRQQRQQILVANHNHLFWQALSAVQVNDETGKVVSMDKTDIAVIENLGILLRTTVVLDGKPSVSMCFVQGLGLAINERTVSEPGTGRTVPSQYLIKKN